MRVATLQSCTVGFYHAAESPDGSAHPSSRVSNLLQRTGGRGSLRPTRPDQHVCCPMIRGGTPHRSSVFRGGAATRKALTGQPDFLITLVTLSLSRRGFGPHSITRAQRASLNSPALLSRSPGTASRRPGHPRQDWLEDRVALAVAAHVVLPLIPPTTAKACQYSCRDPTLTITRWPWNRLTPTLYPEPHLKLPDHVHAHSLPTCKASTRLTLHLLKRAIEDRIDVITAYMI